MRIKSKLTWLLLGVGIPTILVASGLGYLANEQILKDGVTRNLAALGESKRRHLEFYFRSSRQSVGDLSEDPLIASSFTDLRAAFNATAPAQEAPMLERHIAEQGLDPALASKDPIGRRLQEAYIGANRFPTGEFRKLVDLKDGSPYSAAHVRHHADLRREEEKLGFDDLLLVDLRSQRVIYSVRKHLDFASTLTESNSALKKAVDEAANGRVTLTDFQAYGPDAGGPVSFFAAPIRINGRIEGVVAVRVPIAQLDKIVSGDGNWEAEGLGDSGETLLVGLDGTLRSDSRFLLTDKRAFLNQMDAAGAPAGSLSKIDRFDTTILSTGVDPALAQLLAKDDQGVAEVRGYRGQPVFAAYTPLAIAGLRWSIVSQIRTDEAMAPLAVQQRTTLVTALCLIIVMIGVAWLAANHFVQPIKRLGDAAQRFGQGETGVRTNFTSGDELGELGRTFDAMVEEAEHLEEIAQSLRRNIVHDLKTPLAVVKGMAETLRHPDIANDPETRSEMVAAIIEQSDRLLDDLSDILVPVDIHYRPEPEEFDLSLMVERAVKNEQHTKRAENHELIVRGTDVPIMVFADSRKIRRVLENLISNAVKYSPGEGKHVTIEVVQDAEEVEVHVQDEGMGMNAEQLNQVLGEGGRALGHELIGIEGTGIGLGSVQLILEAHGGELRALSQPGIGSRFTAIFPRQMAQGQAQANGRATA
jgi:signal transduction histidine kinase